MLTHGVRASYTLVSGLETGNVVMCISMCYRYVVRKRCINVIDCWIVYEGPDLGQYEGTDLAHVRRIMYERTDCAGLLSTALAAYKM